MGYFRFTVLVAFWAFIHEGVDAAVLEVGLGGIRDSTNIIPPPRVCGVTLIDYDHIHVLGSTLPEIAANVRVHVDVVSQAKGMAMETDAARGVVVWVA